MAKEKVTYEQYIYDEIIHITAKAILFDIDGLRYWVPKSIVSYDDNMFEIPSWFELEEAENFGIKSKQEEKSNKPFKNLFS